MKTKIITSILFCFLSTILTSQIIHVPADKPTIRAGILAASEGDTVLVADATYYENINFLGKAIIVASAFILDGDTNHINNTIINGSQPSDPDFGSVVTFNMGEDTTSVLCGFTISGGSGMADIPNGSRIGGGIVCYNSSAKIIYNKITLNEVSSESGAFGGGIACSQDAIDSSRLVLNNNVITYNQSLSQDGLAFGGGIAIDGNAIIVSNSIIVNQCTSLTGNAKGGGLYHESSNYPIGTLYLENNLILNNSAEATELVMGGGVFSAWSNIFASGNQISDNSLTGKYVSGGGIALESENETEIAGNQISNNSVTGDSIRGGGIAIYYGDQTDIKDNLIKDNTVGNGNNYWFGAGLYFYMPSGITHVVGNEFSSNSGPVAPVGAGGGLCIVDAGETSITVNANRFVDNIAFHGGGIFERSSYHTFFTNNIFYGNYTFRGGGIGMFHPVTKSGLESLNTLDSHPRIMNNTFYANLATSDGGAVRFQGTINAPEIINCIFWNNIAPLGKDIRNYDNLPVTVSYCDIATISIEGPWTGEGNISADPQFVFGDTLYHLSESSPCRDSGKEYLYTPKFDCDGDARPDPVFALMDMGADEFYEIPAAPVVDYPNEIGSDYFIAIWNNSIWAQGYYLDVALDEDFNNLLPDYNNYNVGNDTIQMVENLESGLLYYYRVRAYNGSGTSPNSQTMWVLSVNVDEMQVHDQKREIRVFPNPFKSSTILDYELNQQNIVRITFYDQFGKQVDLIEENQQKGLNKIIWTPENLADGIYYFRFQAGAQRATGMLVVMK